MLLFDNYLTNFNDDFGESNGFGRILASTIDFKPRLCVKHRVNKNNQKTSVFHSNGFGGAGLEMAIAEKWLSGLIDLTTHEATRIWIKGAHMPMPMRFSEQKLSYLPRVTVPGGINFLSLGSFSSLSKSYQKRQFFN